MRKTNTSPLVASRYLTVEECSREYSYSADYFRKMAARGLVGSIKIGGPKSRLLIVRRDIDHLFAKSLRPRRELVTS